MLFRIFFLFVGLPLLDLLLFFRLLARLGSIGLMVAAGSAILGLFLLNRSKTPSLREMQEEIQRGGGGTDSKLWNAWFRKAAGIFLLFPGFLTDGLGLALLSRQFRSYVRTRITQALLRGLFGARFRTGSPGGGGPGSNAEGDASGPENGNGKDSGKPSPGGVGEVPTTWRRVDED